MTTATVTVNGAERSLPDNTTIADLVCQVTGQKIENITGLAVAVNDHVVRRSSWATTAVSAGSRVELVTATQGG